MDIVIHDRERGLVLVDPQESPPYGNALPGGFINLGEWPPSRPPSAKPLRRPICVSRLTGLLGVYSAPDRNPRQHTISTVFIAEPLNPEQLRAGDDAAKVSLLSRWKPCPPSFSITPKSLPISRGGCLYGGRSAARLTTPW